MQAIKLELVSRSDFADEDAVKLQVAHAEALSRWKSELGAKQAKANLKKVVKKKMSPPVLLSLIIVMFRRLRLSWQLR